jgi:hypothetical protein
MDTLSTHVWSLLESNNHEKKRAIVAAMDLEDVDAALRTCVPPAFRIVPWDILSEPSYLHDSIPIHMRLNKYLKADGNDGGGMVVVRISNVDVDLSTRTNGALELLACVNDPAVRCTILVATSASLKHPFGPQAHISKKSRAQLDAAIYAVVPHSAAAAPAPGLKKARRKGAKKGVNPREKSLLRDVALFQLQAGDEDIGESFQVSMRSIADGIAGLLSSP